MSRRAQQSILAIRALALTLVLALSTSTAALVVVIQVPGDYATIAEALAGAPDHAVIEIAAGTYTEALVVNRPVSLQPAGNGEVLLSPAADEPVITVRDASAVNIEGLTIVGGEYGIFVTHSQDVTIRDNVISDSRLVGIKVRLGAADILDNTVFHAQPPYGMGIHVTNTTQWPTSRVIGNLVYRPYSRSGIYTNMTGMIEVFDNVVTDNGHHGIAITEMSHADVFGNIVVDNTLTGIQLLDMSMAHICDNIVSDTRGSSDAPQIRQGNGIIIDYHSEATLSGNTIQSSAQHGVSILFGSTAFLHENTIEGSEAQSVFVDESEALDGYGCAGEG